ncbi:hypothetical protein NL676_003784 [Syzygium grande]|nr:hypothetical protein NL676_003784 [Syzygium grande]
MWGAQLRITSSSLASQLRMCSMTWRYSTYSSVDDDETPWLDGGSMAARGGQVDPAISRVVGLDKARANQHKVSRMRSQGSGCFENSLESLLDTRRLSSRLREQQQEAEQ